MNDESAEQSSNSVSSPIGTISASTAATSSLPQEAVIESVELKTEVPRVSESKSNPVWQFFWLKGRVASATAQEFGPSSPAWRDFVLAQQARAALGEIREIDTTNFPILLLARSEVLLLTRCHMQRIGLETPGALLTELDWNRACRIPVIAKLRDSLSSEQWSNVVACLGAPAETFLGELDPMKRSQLAASLREMASVLIEPLESDASRVRRILLLRWSRIGTALVAVFAALWVLGGWLMDRAGTVNLALNRPVTISSQCAGLGTDHRLLVDGDRTNLGFHTDNGPDQFAVIDLGSIKRFDKVVVYNRIDCCKERAVPMRLEVSNDGKTYTKLADRTEQFDIWTAKSLRGKGRYLRLRLLTANPFHLAEVEVY